MTDRELLELAAKAAGIAGKYQHWEDSCSRVSCGIAPDGRPGREWWNPLTDDGDEARLEATLSLNVKWGAQGVIVGIMTNFSGNIIGGQIALYADHGADKQAARRRAGVLAAVEIGKAM